MDILTIVRRYVSPLVVELLDGAWGGTLGFWVTRREAVLHGSLGDFRQLPS